MSATHLLATHDADLLRAWRALVPPGRPVITLAEVVGLPLTPVRSALVVVLDAAAADRLPAGLERCPTIFVGEPRSAPFERARSTDRAHAYLSYHDSRDRLAEFLPLVEEIAERGVTIELLNEKKERSAELALGSASLPSSRSSTNELWDFIDAAVENLAHRDLLLNEFRRAFRVHLHTSCTVFFLPEENQRAFRADLGGFVCSFDDPLIHYLSKHPVVLDETTWTGPHDLTVERALRRLLASWSARLIAPIHDNGKLLGLVALGVREDGQSYDAADRARIVSITRLLRQFLQQCEQLGRLSGHHERWRTGEKYFPNLLVLGENEPPPKDAPVAVRTLMAEIRSAGEVQRLVPSLGQPYRARVGPIPETGGIWAWWEDASSELMEQAKQQRRERLALLCDIALTLNHEIGNALVSLMALRHNPGTEINSPVLLGAIKRDIGNLETINRHLSAIPTFGEVNSEEIDLCELLRQLGQKTGVAVDTAPQGVKLRLVPKLVEFALEAIVESVAENRPDYGKRDLVLQLRSTGEGEQLTALLSVKGKNLELEGILPAPRPGAIPSHGRIGVFIAKEIVRLHGGELHAGPGTEGMEILISIRNW